MLYTRGVMEINKILPKDSTPVYVDGVDKAISRDARKWWNKFRMLYSELENNPHLSNNCLTSCSDTFVNGKLADFILSIRENIKNMK